MAAAVPAGHRDPAQAWGAVGHLRLTVQSTLLGPMKHAPSCEIDGESVPIRNGENVILVHAGRHHVEAPSFYRAVEGRLGPEPQQAAGMWFILMVLIVLAAGLLITAIR